MVHHVFYPYWGLRRSIIIGAASLWLLVPSNASVLAQLVQIGPGFVKAPFVRVYSYADGSSYVRAPFVSVYSPPRPFLAPIYGYAGPGYSVATQDDFDSSPDDSPSGYEDLDWGQLRQLAQDNLARLDRNLDASWRDYLSTEQLGLLIADDINEPLREQQIEQLIEILSNFEATLNSPNMRHVTEAPGFRELHAALVELSLTHPQRVFRQLLAAKSQLDRDLSTINAPTSWQDYLRIPISSEAFETSEVPLPPDTTDDSVAGLEKTLSHYDRTAEDVRYRMIADLPGFRATRSKLQQYMAVLNDPSALLTPDSVEQLPLPPPEGSS